MRTLSTIAIALSLSLSTAFVPAQGKRLPAPGGGVEEDDRCTCSGLGASCFFGHSGACTVTCPRGMQCECTGGSCFLGFPLGASCTCVA